MSFALTTEQIRNRTKTVTRRLAWTTLKPGTLLQPVVKCQGIPKGGTVEKIGAPILVVRVHRERLDRMTGDLAYGRSEVRREGFPKMSPTAFVAMFCEHNKCSPHTVLTRIAFTYVEAEA